MRLARCADEAGFVHLGQTCYFEMKGKSYIIGEDVEGAVTRSALLFEKVILGS